MLSSVGGWEAGKLVVVAFDTLISTQDDATTLHHLSCVRAVRGGIILGQSQSSLLMTKFD